MSITYCHYCDRHIDTDFEAEHFDTLDDKDNLNYCIEQEQEDIDQIMKERNEETKKMKQGLTNKKMKTHNELLIKANTTQLFAMLKSVEAQLEMRGGRQ